MKFYTKQVAWRARTIVSEGGVSLAPDSAPRHLHFLVTQRDGRLCDVWKTTDRYGRTFWSCSAAREDPNDHPDTKKDKKGCVTFGTTVRPEEPFCSHTLAAELFLKGESL